MKARNFLDVIENRKGKYDEGKKYVWWNMRKEEENKQVREEWIEGAKKAILWMGKESLDQWMVIVLISFSLKMCGRFFLSSLLVSSRMNEQGGKGENRNKIRFVSQSSGGLQPWNEGVILFIIIPWNFICSNYRPSYFKTNCDTKILGFILMGKRNEIGWKLVCIICFCFSFLFRSI